MQMRQGRSGRSNRTAGIAGGQSRHCRAVDEVLSAQSLLPCQRVVELLPCSCNVEGGEFGHLHVICAGGRRLNVSHCWPQPSTVSIFLYPKAALAWIRSNAGGACAAGSCAAALHVQGLNSHSWSELPQANRSVTSSDGVTSPDASIFDIGALAMHSDQVQPPRAACCSKSYC